MTAMSNYLEDELLDHAVGVGSWTTPTNVYAKLHTGDPGEDGTTNAATETTRKVITFGTPSSGGTISNTAALTWSSVSTTETYDGISLWDALTGGNCLFVKNGLTASVPVTAGDDFEIAIGDLDITFD